MRQLCYASKLLKEGKKTITASGSPRKLVHMLTDDLVEACNQSVRKLKALTLHITLAEEKFHLEII